MPYAPFKMSGHTLPGPNQSSALKAIQVPMNNPAKSAEEMGINLRTIDAADIQAAMGKTPRQTQVGENYEGGEDYTAIKEAENTQPYVNSGDSDISAVDGGTTKKKVDVEVTVNDKKI